jgi:hypothetical protein
MLLLLNPSLSMGTRQKLPPDFEIEPRPVEAFLMVVEKSSCLHRTEE